MTELIASAPSKEVSSIESASHTINDFAKPTNQFNWSDNYIKLLAKYKANPFEHALALKPDETSADSNTPILATDITDKPLSVMQEKWLALINNALLETDDRFASTIKSRVEDWYDLYKQCNEERDARYDIGGLNYKRAYLSAYKFSEAFPHQLFPRLSLSKQISLFAVQRHCSGLLSISTHYQSMLRYIQAFIHQLKTDDPYAYQDLYQRHNQSHPEILPIFFCADVPYPKESLKYSLLIDGPKSDDSDRTMRALFLHLTDSSQAKIFTQAYHAAISSSDYNTIDILPPLLRFIDSCEQADAPDLIIDLLDKRQLDQKQNQHLFEVLEDFDHELYLEWLVAHYHYLEVSKPLSVWTKRYPILTISKLIKRLDTDYQTRVSFPDFSTMTKSEISNNYSFRKPDLDILALNTDYLIELLTHLCATLHATHPEVFALLKIIIDSQNFTHYDSVIAPIFKRASQVNITDEGTALPQHLEDKNLDQVSKWLISPPWLHEEYRLHTPRATEHIVVEFWINTEHYLPIPRL